MIVMWVQYDSINHLDSSQAQAAQARAEAQGYHMAHTWVNWSIQGPNGQTRGGPQTSDSSGPFHQNSTRGEVGGVVGRGVGTGILGFGGQCVL